MNAYLLKRTIVVVDPEGKIEKNIREALKETNIKIACFSSDKECLESIPELKPAVILSLFDTSKMNGRLIFDKFTSDSRYIPYRHIPFIFFSDEKTRSIYGKEMFDRGLWAWFTERFGIRELREIIENLLMSHEMIERNLELRQKVRKSEYKYRDLLENANDFIFTLDHDGKFVYLNNRFPPMTGFKKEEWIGKKFIDLISSENKENAYRHYEMTHRGKARIFEARIECCGERYVILSFNITPILEHGKIIGSIGIGRDVTEQKKMEKEITDLKNFNESIIQSMEAGLLTTDLDGRITSLNMGGQKILGWTEKEVLGKPIRSVLKPEEADYIFSRPSSPDSLPYSRETELTVKSGEKISIGFTATDRIDNTGKKVGSIVSFRDISELKRMRSEIIRMDRLASLGVLASGIAHEIKNPLAGIKTMAQACEDEFDEEDPRKEYLSRIIRQVNRLDGLLKTFFAFARPKPPDRKPHDLSEILREVMNLVEKKLKVNNIRYVEELEKNLPAVMVDSQQMQQVFLNLILNAIDAMPEGGELKIFANIKKSDGRKFVSIDVIDTGIGIDDKDKDTIFDPFFTTKSTGLGLGLSIVYRIIQEHRGDISVDSEPGAGTCFKIKLPLGV